MELELHYDDIVELRQIAMHRVERMGKSSEFSKIHTPAITTMLTPTEIITEQTNIKTEDDIATLEQDSSVKSGNAGVLAWFFPSWSSSSTSKQSITEQQPSLLRETNSFSSLNNTKGETDFDEAILGEMKAFGRDVLLARFNFTLNQGSVLLNKHNGPFLGNFENY